MAMSRAGKKRMMLGAAVVAAGGMAAGVYVVRKAQLRRDMARWLADGLEAHDRGDYQTAVENLNEFVSRDKTNADALFDFADARRHIPMEGGQHLSQAISITQLALQISPESLPARRMLMELYTARNQWPEAKDAAERVIELDPKNLDAYLVCVTAFRVAGRNAEVIGAAQRMSRALADDLDVQRRALGSFIAAGADNAMLEDFVAECESRFPTRLGTKLMRLGLSSKRAAELSEGSPERTAAEHELRDALRAAAATPAETSDEARTLIGILDRFDDLSALADQTLERLMQNPTTAKDLAAFAASRRWSNGDFAGAGAIILRSSLDEASDAALAWLALSGLPEAADARNRLEARRTPATTAWLALVKARDQLAAGESLAAADALASLSEPNDETMAAVELYLTGAAREDLGETAQAARAWEVLLESEPAWGIARESLTRAYMAMGRLQDARDLLFGGGRQGNAGLLALRVTVMLEEQGVLNPASPSGAAIADSALEQYPDSPQLRIWGARAHLARNELAPAVALVDQLLADGVGDEPADAVTLAVRLEPLDPSRAERLRAKIGAVATTPEAAYPLALSLLEAGRADDGRALLDARLEQAPEAEKPLWRLVHAAYLDETGDPGAAAALLAASAERPADLHTQQIVLGTISVWHDPRPLDEVIARLRAITGDKATQWRIYRNKRELALLDRTAPDLVQRANGVVLDLASVIQADPTNVQALRVSADASSLAGDNTRAADTLLRAVRAEPADLELQLTLVRALKLAGRIDEARRNARDLADLPVTNPALRRARAEALDRFGFTDLAASDWEALAGGGDPAAAVRYARTLFASGQTDEADRMVADIESQPTVPDTVLRDIAAYYAIKGEVGRGLACLERLSPSGDLGNRDEAIAQLLALTAQETADARDMERRFANSTNGGVWAYIARAYLRIDQIDEARRITDSGLRVAPDSPDLASLHRMFAAEDAGDTVSQLGLMGTMLRFSDTPEAEACIAAIDLRLANQIDNDTLISRLDEIVQHSPTSIDAWKALATVYLTARRGDDLRTTLLRAMDARNTDPDIAKFATRMFHRVGMTDDALLAARTWRDRVGTLSYDADQAVALQLVSRGQGSEAATILRPWRNDIIAKRDLYPGDALLLARALAQSGDIPGAETVAGPFTRAEGGPAQLYVAIADVIANPDTRRDWLRRTTPEIEARGDDDLRAQIAGAWMGLARASNAADDAREAMRLADAGLQRPDTNHFDLLVTKAEAQLSLADWEGAQSTYRTLADLAPTNPDIHNNLAFALLQAKGDAADALSHAIKACDLAKAANLPAQRTRSYLDTQAQALLALARPGEAAQLYQTALQADPRWDYGLVGLAESLVAASRIDEAKAVFEKLTLDKLSDDLAPRAEAVRVSLGE